MRIIIVLLCLGLGGSVWSEETFDGQVAATRHDQRRSGVRSWRTSVPIRPPAIFGQRAQLLQRRAFKKQAIHEGAREALGFVRVGDRWVYKQFAPKGASASTAATGKRRCRRTRSIPAKAQAGPWCGTTPSPWIPIPPTAVSKYVDRLTNVANDNSHEMDVSIDTCIDAKYLAVERSAGCARRSPGQVLHRPLRRIDDGAQAGQAGPPARPPSR